MLATKVTLKAENNTQVEYINFLFPRQLSFQIDSTLVLTLGGLSTDATMKECYSWGVQPGWAKIRMLFGISSKSRASTNLLKAYVVHDTAGEN